MGKQGREKVVPEGVLSPFCPVFTRAIEIIGRRWTGAIVRAMLAGNTRFSELSAAIPGLSDRLLSERLKELEAEGIIERSVTPTTPVRIDYSLSRKGQDLAEVVQTISAWATAWAAPGTDETVNERGAEDFSPAPH